MIVRELIERLQQCDPEATVYLADWQEGSAYPSSEAAEFPIVSGVCSTGSYAVIGDDDPRLQLVHRKDYPHPPERK